jgi:hypothetical protein
MNFKITPPPSLVGELPDCMNRLTHLSTLIMSCNALCGKLPSSLGSLSSLKVLRLSGNKVDDTCVYMGEAGEGGRCMLYKHFNARYMLQLIRMYMHAFPLLHLSLSLVLFFIHFFFFVYLCFFSFLFFCFPSVYRQYPERTVSVFSVTACRSQFQFLHFKCRCGQKAAYQQPHLLDNQQ